MLLSFGSNSLATSQITIFYQIHRITNYKRFDHWLWNAVKKKKRKIIFNCFFIKKFWFQHNCSIILWYGFKGEISAIIIFFKIKYWNTFLYQWNFLCSTTAGRILINISIYISFTIVTMTYDVYISFKLTFLVVECMVKNHH